MAWERKPESVVGWDGVLALLSVGAWSLEEKRKRLEIFGRGLL